VDDSKSEGESMKTMLKLESLLTEIKASLKRLCVSIGRRKNDPLEDTSVETIQS
jgi:hypothetical protein